MKVLQVRDAAGDRPPVDLHGQVTVVRGLDPLRRAWLIDVLGRLASGDDIDATGEIAAHGIVFSLDRTSLALLDLEQPVASVVRAEDLPGHDPRIAQATADRDRALMRAIRSGSAASSLMAAASFAPVSSRSGIISAASARTRTSAFFV